MTLSNPGKKEIKTARQCERVQCIEAGALGHRPVGNVHGLVLELDFIIVMLHSGTSGPSLATFL